MRGSSKSKRPRRRKCAYCGKYGLASAMVGTPTGVYRSESNMAHKKCRDEVMTPPNDGADSPHRLVRRLVFIDDDEDNRRQWLEWSDRNGYSAKAFDTAFEANDHMADCYIFDVSAVSPMMVGHHAYAPICRLMQDHPGAEIIIGSCMSRNAVEDVLDDVERVAGRRPRFFDASSGFDGLEAVMKTLNGELNRTTKTEDKPNCAPVLYTDPADV